MLSDVVQLFGKYTLIVVIFFSDELLSSENYGTFLFL